jgi:Lon protease-like protein
VTAPEHGASRLLPMFPLSTVLFPGAVIPLHIFEPRYRELTRDCLAGDGRFGIVLIERGTEVGGGDQRASVGTQVRIIDSTELPDGRWLMLVQGEVPIHISEWLPDDPYPLAQVQVRSQSEDAVDLDLLERAHQCLRRTRGLLSESGASAPMPASLELDPDPERASWQLCAEAPVSAFDAQRLLSSPGPGARIDVLIELVEAVEEDVRRLMLQ